jgi:hypothetical protein
LSFNRKLKNMKTKPVILVIITLIIGFVLGMLTSAQIRYQRLKPVKVFFSEERFREGFYRTIQPNDQQKVKIEQILDKYAKINGDIQNNFRREIDASMKEFRKEIDANLTKDQIARLKAMDERRQKMIRQNRRGHEQDTLERRGVNREPHMTFPEDQQHSSIQHDSIRGADIE